MKRSAIVWEYSGQTSLVEERYAAYAAHRANVHAGSDASDDAEEPADGMPQPLVRTGRRRRPSRSVLINLGIGIAVLTLVALLLFLHVA
jgi:anti-sigma factor RsiW